jgi:pantoate--beta-alanine ligase
MMIVRTVADLRSALASGDRPVGLVPTMGALHDGHLSLIRSAAAECEQVVVSLFVNPSQFNESSDLDSYPRDETRDADLARTAGATLLFAPGVDEVYPPGFSTSVQVSGPLTESLEGAHRGPSHFHGVTTVVTKLLNMVRPDVAYFGQKDAQQALVIRKLVIDLDMDIDIEVLPTVREEDGLALSSRNTRLAAEDRQRALALHHALTAARDAAGQGAAPPAVREAALTAMRELDVSPEYLELVDAKSLHPIDRFNGTDVLVAVAAHVGDVRLIDNTLLPATTRKA